jgi:hypothetical protein
MKPLVFKDPHLHLFKVHTAGAIKYISLRNWGRAITTLIVGERAELRLNPNTAVFSASGEARILRQDGRVDVVELARQAGGSLLAIYDVPNAEQRPQTGIRRRACHPPRWLEPARPRVGPVSFGPPTPSRIRSEAGFFIGGPELPTGRRQPLVGLPRAPVDRRRAVALWWPPALKPCSGFKNARSKDPQQ